MKQPKIPLIIKLTLMISLFFISLNGCRKDLEDSNGEVARMVLADSINFAVIGDFGEEGTYVQGVADMVHSWTPDFIITTGDNNYEGKDVKSFKKAVGQYYNDYIYNPDAPSDLICTGKAHQERMNRFFPTTGNHDFNVVGSNKAYLSYFTLPGNEEYYDFVWGPVHFLTISTGPFGNAHSYNGKQKDWLRKKLQESPYPWKVVYFHHSPYSTSKHGNHKEMQWPFREWGASAVLCGHDHAYVRVTKNENPEFPYIVNGLGGNNSKFGCGLNPLDASQFSAFCYSQTLGAMRVSATRSQLAFRFFSVTDQSKPIDEFVIRK